MGEGCLFVISAPSGAGKTSLVKAVRDEVENIGVSISHTTRGQRPGEVDGRDYYFVSRSEFDELIQQEAFLEYAEVFGNLYGTTRREVEARLDSGWDLILEIDWQGAAQVRRLLPDSVSIFILPPSPDSLLERLRRRGQDTPDEIERRIDGARAEMRQYAAFDYLVINDDFPQAVADLKAVIRAQRLTRPRQEARYRTLFQAIPGLMTQRADGHGDPAD